MIKKAATNMVIKGTNSLEQKWKGPLIETCMTLATKPLSTSIEDVRDKWLVWRGKKCCEPEIMLLKRAEAIASDTN
jgi:hypothetical protein